MNHWTAGHLELIARFPAETQLNILEDFSEDYYHDEYSIAQLDQWLGRFMQLMKYAPWADNYSVCGGCRKRSSCQPGLFDEVDGDSDKNDRCLDGVCWEKQEAAYLDGQIARQKEKHPELALITGSGIAYYEATELKKQHKGLMMDCEVESVRKSDPQAVPAFVVAGKGQGKLRWVKPRSTSATGVDRQAAGPKTLKQRRKELDAKRWAQVLNDLCEEIDGLGVKALLNNDYKFTDELSAVVMLTICFGTDENEMGLRPSRAEPWEFLGKIAAGKKIDPLLLWDVVRPVLLDRLGYNGPVLYMRLLELSTITLYTTSLNIVTLYMRLLELSTITQNQRPTLRQQLYMRLLELSTITTQRFASL